MNKKNVIIGIVALSLSFGLGYFATPNKIVTKEVVKTVKEEGKTKVITKEKIVYKDGTTVERETDAESSHSRETLDRTSEKSVTKDSGLTLSALAIYDTKDMGQKQEYGITVSKRVLGAVNVTGLVTSDRKIGVGLGWSF